MAEYKTPGVYIEEVSTLPASIAAVPTAIPAFIGLTEKAENRNNESLLFKPARLSSLREYEEMFGYAPPNEGSEIILDENLLVKDHDFGPKYYLYNSLKLFYDNGGGDCYILSIGLYGASETKSDYFSALAALEKEDEPTLILAPDLIRLGRSAPAEVFEIQTAIIDHCANLQDRFAVLDLFDFNHAFDGDKVTAKDNYADFDLLQSFLDNNVAAFRDNIGLSNLKYGAVYTPYLQAKIPKNITFTQIDSSLKKGSVAYNLQLTADTQEVSDLISSLRNDIGDQNKMELYLTDETGGKEGLFPRVVDVLITGTPLMVPMGVADDLSTQWALLVAEIQKKGEADSHYSEALANALRYLYETYYVFTRFAIGGDAFAGSVLPAAVTTLITNSLKPQLKKIAEVDRAAEADTDLNANAPFDTDQVYDQYPVGASKYSSATFFPSAPWDVNTFPSLAVFPFAGTSAEEKAQETVSLMDSAFNLVLLGLAALKKAVASALIKEEASLMVKSPAYKSIYDAVSNSLSEIPPSGAVVGQYARTDATRGVWKAPANVSINGINGLTLAIDSDEQENLNVDVQAGKSINVIRTFTGRGHLIWGARTLAGNDNEWRYIPVRRLFIMVEESIKKATEFVVFEPNDAKTWGRTKAMISSFLTRLWADGALAGAKPEAAFFVRAGLGETMTAQDILEGRLIIEIGMAAVRPAEFIILRFMHKLQES